MERRACTFGNNPAGDRQKVQLPKTDDIERCAVPRAQAESMEGQGGVTKSKFGGSGWGEYWIKSGFVAGVTLRYTMKGEENFCQRKGGHFRLREYQGQNTECMFKDMEHLRTATCLKCLEQVCAGVLMGSVAVNVVWGPIVLSPSKKNGGTFFF